MPFGQSDEERVQKERNRQTESGLLGENPQKPQTDRGVPGSVPFVPPAAGLILASEVVRDLLMFL